MIVERPRPLLGAFVRWVLRRRLREGLSAVRVLGLDRLRELGASQPLLLCANHVCFWDGFLVEQLCTSAGLKPRVLMLAGQLRAAPLLRWAGCFGLEQDDIRDGVRAIRHAASLLDTPGRAVRIFPQGAQRPQWMRPLLFQPGAALVSRTARAAGHSHAVVPISLHYELGERERPEAWVRIGEPMAGARSDPHAETQALEQAVRAGLDELQLRVLSGERPRSLWPGPARLGEGMASRLLALQNTSDRCPFPARCQTNFRYRTYFLPARVFDMARRAP